MKTSAHLKLSSHGIFYFRRVVPKHLVSTFSGRTEIKRSLQTRDPKKAKLLAMLLVLRTSLAFQRAEQAMGYKPKNFNPLDPDTFPTVNDKLNQWELEINGIKLKADPNNLADQQQALSLLTHLSQLGAIPRHIEAAPDTGTPRTPQQPIAGEDVFLLVERFASNNQNRLAKKTLYEYRKLQERFCRWISAAKGWKQVPITSISKLDLADYVEYLRGERGLSDITIDNKHLAAISGVFRFAQKTGRYPEGSLPTENLRTLTKQDRNKLSFKKAYQPFTGEDLAKIFGPSLLLTANKPHQYWIPLLGLFTGARLNELAQLDWSDVKVIDGVPSISINQEDDKSVKSIAATRDVPIHQQLLDLGFLDYVQLVKSLTQSRKLFPYLTPDTFGNFGKDPSREFGDRLDDLEITSPYKVFHSFRKTANNTLKQGGVSEEIRCQLIGHEHETVNSSVYGEKFSVTFLKEVAVEKLVFPEVDFGKLMGSHAKFEKLLPKLYLAKLKRDKVALAKKERLGQLQVSE